MTQPSGTFRAVNGGLPLPGAELYLMPNSPRPGQPLFSGSHGVSSPACLLQGLFVLFARSNDVSMTLVLLEAIEGQLTTTIAVPRPTGWILRSSNGLLMDAMGSTS